MADTDAESPLPPAENVLPLRADNGERVGSRRREALKVQLANLQTRLALLNGDLRGIASTLRRLRELRK